MKKKNIVNLIRYFAEKNEPAFRAEAFEIAKDFDSNNDSELAEYITALLSTANVFVPQMQNNESYFLKKIQPSNELLPLPNAIEKDLIGIINAIQKDRDVSKFLFYGAPGTGKTESVKHIARILERDLFSVNFDSLIDSKLGQTSKNISSLFDELNNITHPNKVIILFDEIDALALDRTNSNDLREMGRATSALLRGFDQIDSRIVIIATTNLFEKFDKALIRRFDTFVNFNRYTQADLFDIGNALFNHYVLKFKINGKNTRLFKKILLLCPKLPYPGELKNTIKTALAFSDPEDNSDFLRRLYESLIGQIPTNVGEFQKQGFTVRETEIFSGISKSQVARSLQAGNK